MASSDSDTAAVRRNRRAESALFRGASSSPPARPSKTAKRPPPRFLGDDVGAAGNAGRDDLFGDLDDLPDMAPVPARLNANAFDELTKAREASPVDKLWDDLDAAGIDGVPEKKKRVIARMDEARLLGPSGLSKLQQDVKKFKTNGKGNEIHDLKRLMTVYQLWAHQMYPKTNLRDTLQTVEKLCHKRSVQRSVRQFRDDIRQAKAKENAEKLGVASDDDEMAPAAAPVVKKAAVPDVFEDDMFGDDDFGDEEELLAQMERDAVLKPAAAKPVPRAAPSWGGGGNQEDDEDAEAEAMLREMEMIE